MSSHCPGCPGWYTETEAERDSLGYAVPVPVQAQCPGLQCAACAEKDEYIKALTKELGVLKTESEAEIERQKNNRAVEAQMSLETEKELRLEIEKLTSKYEEKATLLNDQTRAIAGIMAAQKLARSCTDEIIRMRDAEIARLTAALLIADEMAV